MLSNSMTKTAVVVGSTGIVGRAISAKLAEIGGWRVVGATRSGGTVPGLDEAIAVDLLDAAEARRRLDAARGATHLFFAGYAPQGGFPQEVGPNLALLVNVVEGLEAAGAPLQHVTLVTGAKYYGGPPRALGGAGRGDRATAPRPELLLCPGRLSAVAIRCRLALDPPDPDPPDWLCRRQSDEPGAVDRGLRVARPRGRTPPRLPGDRRSLRGHDPGRRRRATRRGGRVVGGDAAGGGRGLQRSQRRPDAMVATLARVRGLLRRPSRRPAADPLLLLHARAGAALEGDGGQIRARPARARVARELGLPRVPLRDRVRHRAGARQDPPGRLHEAPGHAGRLLESVRRVSPRPDHPDLLSPVAARVTTFAREF